MRRVCVTGIGIVSSVGADRDSTWNNIIGGRSGASHIEAFDAVGWPTDFACEVKDFTLPAGSVDLDYRRYLNRPMSFGLAAALEAMTDSEVEGCVDPYRFAVSVGSNIGALPASFISAYLQAMHRQEHLPVKKLVGECRNRDALKNHPGTLAGLLSMRWNARGLPTTIQTACASSGQSLGHAFQQVARGNADVVLAGGADSLSAEMLLAGFCLIGALSRRNDNPTAASRPFDRDRDGFVAGEGAAMLILEERAHAMNRGAKIYAELSGYGETASAYRITDLPANGRGIVEAMKNAMRQGKLGYEEVHYINAHGTSTELNDRIEALAIRRVFGARGKIPRVSSTKSCTGHLISAAGALEAALTVLAIYHQIVPPTINLQQSDCGDDINFVPNHAQECSLFGALSNSIGFGGSNSSLLFTKLRD